jgi:hypothetical protein
VAAVDLARRRGARAIEGHPITTSEPPFRSWGFRGKTTRMAGHFLLYQRSGRNSDGKASFTETIAIPGARYQAITLATWTIGDMQPLCTPVNIGVGCTVTRVPAGAGSLAPSTM